MEQREKFMMSPFKIENVKKLDPEGDFVPFKKYAKNFMKMVKTMKQDEFIKYDDWRGEI